MMNFDIRKGRWDLLKVAEKYGQDSKEFKELEKIIKKIVPELNVPEDYQPYPNVSVDRRDEDGT